MNPTMILMYQCHCVRTPLQKMFFFSLFLFFETHAQANTTPHKAPLPKRSAEVSE